MVMLCFDAYLRHSETRGGIHLEEGLCRAGARGGAPKRVPCPGGARHRGCTSRQGRSRSLRQHHLVEQQKEAADRRVGSGTRTPAQEEKRSSLQFHAAGVPEAASGGGTSVGIEWPPDSGDLVGPFVILLSWPDVSLPDRLLRGMPAVGTSYPGPCGVYPQQPFREIPLEERLLGHFGVRGAQLRNPKLR